MEDLKFKTADQVMKWSNKEGDSDFCVNRNKGFSMAVNGYTISVQWGVGNYVERDVRHSNENPQEFENWGSDTAEVLIWDRDDNVLFQLAWDNDELLEAQGNHNEQVFGHCSSDCVARMIACLSSCGDEDPKRSIAQIYQASFK